MATLNWGICGCGLISNDFKIALDLLPEDVRSKHKVVAVAARSQERACEFAKARGIEKFYGSYDELLADDDVNVVYVGTVNSTHYEIGMKAIQAKKHVLIEKAMTLEAQHTIDLYTAAEKQGVFVLDAMWTRFFPATHKVVQLIKEGAIGEVMYFHADMAVAPTDPAKWNVEKVLDPRVGGGSLMIAGVYPLYFASLVFGKKEPECIKAIGEMTESGVDRSLGVILKYNGGGLAQLTTSLGFNSPKEAMIVGTRGTIRILYPFWCPNKIIVNDKTIEYASIPLDMLKDLVHETSWGLMYEAEEVRKCIEAGKKESEHMSWRESAMLAGIMDQIKDQIGLRYS